MNRLAQLQRFHESDPTNAELVEALVDKYLEGGLTQDCLQLIESLPVSLRESESIRFRHARCHVVRGDYEKARTELEVLLAGNEQNFTIRHDLAFVCLCQGDAMDAESVLAPVLEAQSVDPVVLALHARILQVQGRVPEAREPLLRALQAMPEDAGLKGQLALVLLDLNEQEEAARLARSTLCQQAENVEANLVVATLDLWEGELDSANQSFDRVLMHMPDMGRALSGQGQLWMIRGDLDKARATLQQAVQNMPQHIGTWHALAWCELLQGDIDAARVSIDRAYALDRTFGETHGALAIIHALRGQQVEAEAAIKRALRLAPNGRSVRYAQALLKLDDGDAEAAAQMIAPLLDTARLPEGQTAKTVLERLSTMMRRS